MNATKAFTNGGNRLEKVMNMIGQAHLRKLFQRRMAAMILGASALLPAVIGCRSNDPQRATIIDNNPSGADPSNANLAPAAAAKAAPGIRPSNVRVLSQQQAYTPQQSTEQYPQQPLPPQYPDENQSAYNPGVDAGYQALDEASQPPPPLPVYDQPPAPEPNDLWTPGYWNYAPQGYFWVPGAWVAAPYAGALWTPGYWGFETNRYRFHHGFWARHVGFYGGINYGFGYTGLGYSGGYWNGGNFYYNRVVNRVNGTNIHNVYERSIDVNNTNRVSYNGGDGGLQARPDPRELAVLHEQRTPAMTTQIQLRQESAQNRLQFYNQNHGQPAQPFATRSIADERGGPTPLTQQVQQQRSTDPRQQQFEQQRTSREQQSGIRPQQFPTAQQEAQQHSFQQQQERQRNEQTRQQQRAQMEQQQRTQVEQQQRVQVGQQQHAQAEQQQRAGQQQQEQQGNADQQHQRSIQQQPNAQQPPPRSMPRTAQQPQAQQRTQPQPQVPHAQSMPQAQHAQPPPQQQQAHPDTHPNPR